MAKPRSVARSTRPRHGTPAPRGAAHGAASLKIRLLGGFEVVAEDGTVLSLATRKAEALIALLAIRPGQVWSRDKICALLWPDVPAVQARHSLRNAVLKARKVLPSPVLKTRGRTLFLDPLAIEVDAAELATRLAEGSASALRRASALYLGDLLEGLLIPEEPFEHWLRFEREELRSLTVQGLSRLTELHTRAGELGAAREACAQLLKLDPLREEAHRSLMRLYSRQGQRSAALQQYQRLARTLRSELGTEPESETEQLLVELSQTPHGAAIQAPPPTLRAGEEMAATSDGPAANAAEHYGCAMPMIGREAELAALTETYERTQKRRSRVALVLGEAGIGKTRLIEHFAGEAAARGARVLRARCYESEQVLPLALWSNLIRASGVHEDASFRAELPEHVRGVLSQILPELFASAQEPPRARDVLSLFQVLRWLLGWLGRAGPLLLLLDDLHWCDELSLRALCFLSRPERDVRPCLFVATAREDEISGATQFSRAMLELDRDRLLARVPLAPLSRAETTLLAQQLAAAHALALPKPEWIERIWAISEGNPLVVVEGARALAAGAIAQDVALLPVPERVRALILGRVARASARARELLYIAAVVGQDLPLELLRRADLDEAEWVAAIEELVEARLLRAEEERVSFTHDRIRETLYSELLPARRRLLHDRVARALQAFHSGQLDEVGGLIGYHHSKAGNAAEAVPLLLRFSDRALRLHGVSDALSALEQALADSAGLTPAERLPTAIDIVTRQGMCLAFLGRLHELLELLSSYEGALLSLDQPALAGPFYFWWGFAESLVGKRDEAHERTERALAQASLCEDRRIVGYSHALLSYLCAKRGAFDEGVRHGTKAMNLLSPDLDAPEAIVIAALNLGLNCLARGDWQDALARVEQAYAIACAAESKRGQALAASGIASIFVHTEQWERALEYCARAVEASQEPFTLMNALWVFGWAQIGSGRPDLAIAVLERALAGLEQQGLRGFQGLGLVLLAQAELAVGNPERALLHANEALTAGEQSEGVLIVGAAQRTLGSIALAVDRLDLARDHLTAAFALFRRCGAPLELAHTLYWQARLESAAGERAAARELHARARAAFATRKIERAVARLARDLEDQRLF